MSLLVQSSVLIIKLVVIMFIGILALEFNGGTSILLGIIYGKIEFPYIYKNYISQFCVAALVLNKVTKDCMTGCSTSEKSNVT